MPVLEQDHNNNAHHHQAGAQEVGGGNGQEGRRGHGGQAHRGLPAHREGQVVALSFPISRI